MNKQSNEHTGAVFLNPTLLLRNHREKEWFLPFRPTFSCFSSVFLSYSKRRPHSIAYTDPPYTVPFPFLYEILFSLIVYNGLNTCIFISLKSNLLPPVTRVNQQVSM